MAKDDPQQPLFDKGEWWHEHWKGMPEYVSKDLTSVKMLYVHFETWEDYEAFSRLIGQRLLRTTQSIWFPEAEIGHFADKRYIDAPQNGAGNDDVEIIGEE
jgi:hypothetical protein